MERICLDEKTIIDFLTGEKSTVEKLSYYSRREEMCVNGITITKLLFTIKKPEVINELIDNMTIIHFDKKAALIAMRIIQDLKERGTKKDWETIYIASSCIANNAFLFTKERSSFEGIRNLKLV